jgi:hypothetical protein
MSDDMVTNATVRDAGPKSCHYAGNIVGQNGRQLVCDEEPSVPSLLVVWIQTRSCDFDLDLVLCWCGNLSVSSGERFANLIHDESGLRHIGQTARVLDVESLISHDR